MKNDELTPAEYRAIIRSQQSHIESQQSHIEKLRGMLWIAADIENDPPMTEADYAAIVSNPATELLSDVIAELQTKYGKGANP